MKIAQIRDEPSTGLWRLHYADRRCRRHFYDDLEPTTSPDEVVAEIDDDPTAPSSASTIALADGHFATFGWSFIRWLELHPHAGRTPRRSADSSASHRPVIGSGLVMTIVTLCV